MSSLSLFRGNKRTKIPKSRRIENVLVNLATFEVRFYFVRVKPNGKEAFKAARQAVVGSPKFKQFWVDYTTHGLVITNRNVFITSLVSQVKERVEVFHTINGNKFK